MPALTLDVDGGPRPVLRPRHRWAFFDAPGGTQVPHAVVDAIAATCASNANVRGAFVTSGRTDAL